VSIDTMRADRLGRLDGSGRSLTPNLDRLADQGVRFERTMSASNESLYSHAAMFTGQLPSQIGSMDYRTFHLPAGTRTLASTLRQAGYATIASVGGGHMSAQFGLSEGFDRYLVGAHFSGFQETVPAALDALGERDEPVFLFVHGYDCHTPYIKPGPAGRALSPEYDGPLLERAHTPIIYEQILGRTLAPDFEPQRVAGAGRAGFISTGMFRALRAHIAGEPEGLVHLGPEDEAFLIGTYDSAVLYADAWLGVLLDRLEAEGFLDDAVVMVVADHGEDLLDHGFINHRAGLWQSTVQVPMILTGPGIAPGTRPATVSLKDLGATLIARAGLAPTLPGTDLLTPPDGGIVITEGAGGQLAAWSNSGGLSVDSRAILAASLASAAPLWRALSDTSTE
jgi:arylsulfatase A-like enzyme